VRRPSHAIRWTLEQLEQHRLLDHQLQRAHARVAQVLIKLARLRLGQMQYEAALMSSLISCIPLVC
jgi:hypothetical protein